MKILGIVVLLVVAFGVLVGVRAMHAGDKAPAVGTAAPDFTLNSQEGKPISLHDFKGKWVVLYFYPKDFTPGCTTEVCTFRDDVHKLHKAGALVLGVSLDDVKSHADFAEKYHVPFPLLSDKDQVAAKEYGVLTFSQKMNLSYAKRETFLIDPQGKIAKHYSDVDPKANSAQVLADLAALKKAAG
jgi:peroxiredoxin Q/BCP